jgi:SAM-dependent methyltransferase
VDTSNRRRATELSVSSESVVPVAAGRILRSAGGSVLSALPVGDQGAAYDRRAALYDQLVASRLYNRLLWGASPAAYAGFAARALASGDGRLLDVACGSLVFTADVYRRSARPLILVDRSSGMLQRAARRLGGDTGATLIQADVSDLPFAPGAFDTVACHGALHVFDDLGGVLRSLRAQLAPGGSLYATCLVAETPVAARYLHLLHRAGEIAAPRRQVDVHAAARAALGDRTVVGRHGAMCFLIAPASLTDRPGRPRP